MCLAAHWGRYDASMRASLVSFANRSHPFTLITGSPREVERGWENGAFDTGLLSCGAIIARTDVIRLPGYGIAAAGPVMSVGVFSDRPWKDLQGKAIRDLSTGVTSPLLLKILWQDAFGEPPLLLRAHDPRPAPAVLVIGDRALRWREEGRFPFFEDLGERWLAAHGTPIPFAYWCVHRSLGHRRRDLVEQALEESVAWGRSHPGQVAGAMRAAAGVGPDTVAAYLSMYRVELGEEEEMGWRQFRDAAKPILGRASP